MEARLAVNPKGAEIAPESAKSSSSVYPPEASSRKLPPPHRLFALTHQPAFAKPQVSAIQGKRLSQYPAHSREKRYTFQALSADSTRFFIPQAKTGLPRSHDVSENSDRSLSREARPNKKPSTPNRIEGFVSTIGEWGFRLFQLCVSGISNRAGSVAFSVIEYRHALPRPPWGQKPKLKRNSMGLSFEIYPRKELSP